MYVRTHTHTHPCTPKVPKYKNFHGTIAHVAPNRYNVYGNIAKLSATELEITELPVRRWTQDYKEQVLELLLHGSEKVEPFIRYILRTYRGTSL